MTHFEHFNIITLSFPIGKRLWQLLILPKTSMK